MREPSISSELCGKSCDEPNKRNRQKHAATALPVNPQRHFHIRCQPDPTPYVFAAKR
jgi:hypothetical protein